MLINPLAGFLSFDGSLMYDDPFNGLYFTMFIYCSLIDSTVHPEPFDNQSAMPFNISWSDVCILSFISFSLIIYCFCFTIEISCFKYHFWLILTSINGCFLNVSFNVSICLIPFISFNCFFIRDTTLSMALLVGRFC